jgi:cell division septation protein DedD
MSVTVLAVVIFLCGVMVGRGTHAVKATPVLADAVDPTAPASPPDTASTPAASGAQLKAAPPSEQELQYPTDLTRLAPPEDLPLEPVPNAPDAAVPAVERREPATRDRPTRSGAERAADAVADTDFREPTGSGFVVQVHAARQRAEATAMAKRLASKGYTAFVTTSGTGAAKMYRVRVGKFAQRREAEAVSRRLEAEEQFKPWVTR